MSGKYIALIPAYEPEPILIDLLRKLCEAEFKIVVVNDGSREVFSEIFEKAATYVDKVLVHDVNKGKGAAIKTGLFYIQMTVLSLLLTRMDSIVWKMQLSFAI